MSSIAHGVRVEVSDRRQGVPVLQHDKGGPASSRPGSAEKTVIGLDELSSGGGLLRIREEVVVDRPFGRLLHFDLEGNRPRPRVLIVSPLSGMRSGMLHDMIMGILPGHDVYCLTWKDAGDVPVDEGPFGLEDNIGYVIDALNSIEGRLHVIGLCQSALPALAATALVAGDSVRPFSLTLIGGKLDTRINPTRMDTLTRRWPLEWYRNFVVTTVPDYRIGRGRRVYSANTEVMMLWTYFLRNFWSGGELFGKVLRDDGADPIQHPFLNSFFSVGDVPAEFYVDTVAQVFHNSALATGQLAWRGTRIAPENILDTALFTIEGELDDISGLGQTRVAHDLCTGIPAGRRASFLCPNVGHLGLFYGSVWRREVLPRFAEFVRQHG